MYETVYAFMLSGFVLDSVALLGYVICDCEYLFTLPFGNLMYCDIYVLSLSDYV